MIFIYLLSQFASSTICSGEDKSYKIGDYAILCVYLNQTDYTSTNIIPPDNLTNVIAVNLTVDKFSGISLTGSFLEIMKNQCVNNTRYLKDSQFLRGLANTDPTSNSSNSSSSSNSTSSNSTSSNSTSSNSTSSNSTSSNSTSPNNTNSGAAIPNNTNSGAAIPNSTYNCNISEGIAVSYGSLISPFSPYLKDKLVSKVYSAVVTMVDGKITKIQWDNFCDICDQDCSRWQDEEVCSEAYCTVSNEKNCDPKIYITWIGTDAKGESLVSSAYRISQFRKYSIVSLYNQAKNKF